MTSWLWKATSTSRRILFTGNISSSNSQTTTCPWKGTANYYDIEVNGKKNPAAAWYYAEPKTAAAQIRGHVAFWKGVQVA